MTLYTRTPNAPLDLIRQRQLHPYVRSQPPPKNYHEAIQSTVSSFEDVKRSLDWYFDVAGFQSSAEEEQELELDFRRALYVWQDDDKFPPHLRSIPLNNEVPVTGIFKLSRLYDTLALIYHPYLVDINGVEKLGPNGATSMAELEVRNKILHDGAKHHWFFQPDNMLTPDNVGLRSDWYTDAVFGQQWFTGTNPTTVTLATPAWFNVFTEAAAGQGNQAVLNLLSTAPPNSFYMLDYSSFRATAGLGPTDNISSTTKGKPTKYGTAAVALFYLPPTGQLHPLGIIIDWKGSLANSVTIFNKRVLPTASTWTEKEDWPWRYAKMAVQIADWTYHEIVVHLLNTHFVEETIVVGAQRTFTSEHIVYRLLKEHWTTTLSINALARSVLVPKVVVPLSCFTEDQVYTVINNEYKSFDFTSLYIPVDLERRGFPLAELDTNPKYHNYGYGRDIKRMWDTLRKFVASVLTDAQYYGGAGGDAKVASDKYILDFCKEMQSPTGGKMSSFPTVTTVDGLIDMVTMCIHIAAPQHTAVNYLQQYYMTFVPNKPSALFNPPPTTLAGLSAINEQDLLNSLPVRDGLNDEWLLMAQVPYLLSPDVEEAVSLPTFAKQAAASDDKVIAKAGSVLIKDLDTLTTDFHKISDEMDDQEKKYEVLIPSATAKSIVI